MGMPKLFMAMVAGTFNHNSLELVGGGLPPALFYRKQSQTIDEISLKGFPLGCVANYYYKKTNIGLKNGDLLFFMTDGLPELFNSNNEMLGLERIKHAFCEVVNEKPSVIIDYLNKTAENWRNGFPLKDDVTFVVFKVKDNSFQSNNYLTIQ
jgi:serine phosphatase RsbU (regulator of sigma subunit)